MKTHDAVNIFITSRQSKNLSPRSVTWYQGILTQFAQECTRLPKKPEQIERFILSRNVGDERRHGYYRALKCFYRFLVKRKYTRHNPIENVEVPRLTKKDPPYLTPDQINKILSQPMNTKTKTAIMTYIDTGARLSEICNLSIEDLLETQYGYIAFISGKTSERPVPLSYETYHALMVNLPFGWTASWLYRQVKRVCRRAGVRATPLTFRHTFATLWSGDELILQQIMGHSSITTTRRYRHLRTQMIVEQHNQYSPLKMVRGSSLDMFKSVV